MRKLFVNSVQVLITIRTIKETASTERVMVEDEDYEVVRAD